MRSHLPGEPAGTTRNIVIVGGVSFCSSEYHLVATSSHPVSYPGIVEDFQHTFLALHAMPCDVILGAHGEYFDLLTKMRRYPEVGSRVFIDPAGYRDFVADGQDTFEKALTEQQAAAKR
jgi:metallo-beta-lactamase class B